MSGTPQAYWYQPGEGELRWMGETSTRFLGTGALTDGAFAFVEEQASQGVSVPLHRHTEDMESFYVLEGYVTFYVGADGGMRVGPGAFVHLPGGTIHGFRIESASARYLILTTPRHGEFYRAITALSSLTSIDGTVIENACKDYGIEFVGPLPA